MSTKTDLAGFNVHPGAIIVYPDLINVYPGAINVLPTVSVIPAKITTNP
ncbi:MAG: hypothetical protein FWH27_04190 [Planctomycetaceae bacterium]|nr:hypothetical protein [Planctomycetaceae bacterium]